MTSIHSRLRLLGTASTLAFAMSVAIATPAQAQDAVQPVPAEDEDTPAPTTTTEAQQAQDSEIIVTGIRGSIRSSVNQKKNNSSIVEVITAEDIGKLPDASIAESLSRLPGLTTQRFDGRSSKLSVRGLAPDFTTTTLNGREMVSSDNNRAVEFDQFPSELLSGAVVYKTPDASLTSQAIGGTVDLLTMRPLNQPGRTVAVSLQCRGKGVANAFVKVWLHGAGEQPSSLPGGRTHGGAPVGRGRRDRAQLLTRATRPNPPERARPGAQSPASARGPPLARSSPRYGPCRAPTAPP